MRMPRKYQQRCIFPAGHTGDHVLVRSRSSGFDGECTAAPGEVPRHEALPNSVPTQYHTKHTHHCDLCAHSWNCQMEYEDGYDTCHSHCPECGKTSFQKRTMKKLPAMKETPQ